MASLSKIEREKLETLFDMGDGWFLGCSHGSMENFFAVNFEVDFSDKKYDKYGTSKAKKMRAFWDMESNELVGKVLLKLIDKIKNPRKGESGFRIPNDTADREELIGECEKIARNLLNNGVVTIVGDANQSVKSAEQMMLTLNQDFFSHIKPLLNNGHYSNSVEEAYKVVRKKLEEITGSEKATEAFKEANYPKIFGKSKQEVDRPLKDFFDGVKYLHMAIQFLRNQKAHTPADKMEKDLAMHYVVLAGLAYRLLIEGTSDSQNEQK